MKPEDIKFVDDVPCIDFTVFDEAGRRDPEKSLKNKASERLVAIHPSLIAAGLLDIVAMRRKANVRRLFPELNEGPNGGYSHDLSKKFASLLDQLGLSDPALCLHSMRHGFRDAGRAAGLPDDVVFALGGWAARGAGNGYGKRTDAVRDAPHLAKVAYGDFRLP